MRIAICSREITFIMAANDGQLLVPENEQFSEF